MATFLLAWNSRRWQWDDIEEMSTATKMGDHVSMRWSCGKSKRPKEGDRAFLIRLGQEPRGIFSSGTITKGSYEDIHWDEEKAALGQKTNFVEVRLDVLLNPDIDVILPRELLTSPPLAEMHWDIQMSGVQIPARVARQLEELWVSFANNDGFALPEEIQDDTEMREGASRQIWVNAYERSPEARRRCIDHYGNSCCVCDFNFLDSYGEIGRNYIHVHHLRQLSEIGEEYAVDPVRDLRPVCPNCHAIIHRRKPAFSIEEAKSFLEKAIR